MVDNENMMAENNSLQKTYSPKKRTHPVAFDEGLVGNSRNSSRVSLPRRTRPESTPSFDSSQSSLHSFFYKKPKKKDSSATLSHKAVPPSQSLTPQSNTHVLSQLTLNFGQRAHRPTLCSECGMQYLPESEEDRKLHDKYHRDFTYFSYQPMKNEKILAQTETYKIICIDHAAPPASQAKAQLICDFVNEKMSAVKSEWSSLTHSLLLYVTRKYITGILLVQLCVTQVVPCTDYVSYRPDETRTLAEPILGIDRIWVAQTRQGIGTLLVRMAQQEYHCESLAFSQPTEAGWKFALTLTKSTPIYIYL